MKKTWILVFIPLFWGFYPHLMGQTGTFRPILKIDTVFTNPYGLVPAFIGYGSTSADTMEKVLTMTDKFEIRFPNGNWKDFYASGIFELEEQRISFWNKAKVVDYEIDLMYLYTKDLQNSLTWLQNGTSFDIRFSVTNINKVDNKPITVYSNIVHIQVLPATPEERLSFVYLCENLKEYSSLINLLYAPNSIDIEYMPKMVEIASKFPNTIIGKMAKLWLSLMECYKNRNQSGHVSDNNVKASIQKTYNELKASPILFLQAMADRFLKDCIN